MKLIKPKQISGEIMTLIDESDEFVVIVSPFVQLQNWTKLRKTLCDLRKRNIPIEFYFRKGNKEAEQEISSLQLEPIPVEKLHCKIFMNEKQGIVSSMNLYQFSDMHSLDIAYKTETKKEYKELLGFYKRYLKAKNDRILCLDEYDIDLVEELYEKLDKNVNIQLDDNEFVVYYGRSRYNFFISGSILELWGIFSSAQFEYATNNNVFFKGKKLSYDLIPGNENDYDQIHSKVKMKSAYLDRLYESEYDKLSESIVEFIRTVDHIKVEEFNRREIPW